MINGVCTFLLECLDAHMLACLLGVCTCLVECLGRVHDCLSAWSAGVIEGSAHMRVASVERTRACLGAWSVHVLAGVLACVLGVCTCLLECLECPNAFSSAWSMHMPA